LPSQKVSDTCQRLALPPTLPCIRVHQGQCTYGYICCQARCHSSGIPAPSQCVLYAMMLRSVVGLPVQRRLCAFFWCGSAVIQITNPARLQKQPGDDEQLHTLSPMMNCNGTADLGWSNGCRRKFSYDSERAHTRIAFFRRALPVCWMSRVSRGVCGKRERRKRALFWSEGSCISE
jgi:hypothetical protein